MKTEIKEEMEEIDDSYSYKSENSHPQSGKRWSQEENLKFCLFMTFFQDIFTHKKYRQCSRIFKKFSLYLGDRTPRQCRSHFQKMILRFKTPLKACSYYQKLVGKKIFDEKFQESSKEFQ